MSGCRAMPTSRRIHYPARCDAAARAATHQDEAATPDVALIVQQGLARRPPRGAVSGRTSRWRSAGELLDGGRGDRGEEVDEVAVRVAEQQRPVAPGHRGGLLDEVLDEACQALVHAVHVVDEELDDHGVG